MTELQQFLSRWESVAQGTLALLRALPADRYDFRPDPGARSMGELAWHLAEVDAYISLGVARGTFEGERPPHIDRPRDVAGLAPGYDVVHREASARLQTLAASDVDAELRYADGAMWSVRDLLWDRLLLHAVHHRGQLVVLCRLAGGIAPGVAGPAREDAGSVRARREAAAASA